MIRCGAPATSIGPRDRASAAAVHGSVEMPADNVPLSKRFASDIEIVTSCTTWVSGTFVRRGGAGIESPANQWYGWE
ncbi:hypothetical protein B1987_02420 [Mycobacterium kansasii]|nr:hypothetical protein B1987_02420 [Mycobacterium kansasii]